MATVAELRAVAKARGVKGYWTMKKAELEKAVGPANVPVDAAVEGIHANVRRLKSMHGLTAEHVTRIAAVKKAIDDLEKHIDKLEAREVKPGRGAPSSPRVLGTDATALKDHYLRWKRSKVHLPLEKDRHSPDALAMLADMKLWKAEDRRKEAREKNIERLRRLRHNERRKARA